MLATALPLGSSLPVAGPAVGDRSAPHERDAARDAGLERRCIAGDEDAFGEIFARYRGKMFSIALHYLRNHADAEEIAQDTFIRAHHNLARFRGDSSLATWLYRIALNLSRNRYKYYAARRRHLTLSLDCPVSDGNRATFAEWIASDAPSPAREAAAGEFSELLIAGMERLGPLHRDILHRRTGLNQSYGDIALALGISPGTVKSRIGRARHRLRALLAEAHPELPADLASCGWVEAVRS